MYTDDIDLVDRGSWSGKLLPTPLGQADKTVEVALTAFALKWMWPDRVHLNRGNHETNGMSPSILCLLALLISLVP
jgi:serine/threonine-protein phosphatase 5